MGQKTNKKKKPDKVEMFFIRNADIRQYVFVIRELTAREIKRKYARSSLGIIWSVLNPLLMMVVMSLIFSTIFRRDIKNFPIYYLTGQVLWTLYSTGTNNAMSALVDNKTLLVRAKLPKHTFILARTYTALVNFGYTCIAYALMLVVFRVKPNWAMIMILPDLGLLLLMTIGVGYMLATSYVFFADIKYLYSIFMTILLYMSALFYPVESLSPAMKSVIECNPVYVSIYIARECVMNGHIPGIAVWIRLGIWSVGAFLIGLAIFKSKENQIMQKV